MQSKSQNPPTKYPFAWPGQRRPGVLDQADVDQLRCGTSGCDNDWRTPGGLRRVGGVGEWRCLNHRSDPDPSPHRHDLRQAARRSTNLALRELCEMMITMLRTADAQEVHDWHCKQRLEYVIGSTVTAIAPAQD